MNELTQVPPKPATGQVSTLTPPPHSVASPTQQRGVKSSQPITFSFALYVVRRWWKVVIPSGLLLAAALGWVAYEMMKREYEGEAWLRVASASSLLADDTRRPGSGNVINSEIGLIRSPLVLAPAVSQIVWDKPRANDVRVRALSEALSVESFGRSELVRITYRDAEPSQAAAVVNAVLDSYFRLRERDNLERSQRVIELLESEQERRSAEVVQLHGELNTLIGRLGENDPSVAGLNGGNGQSRPFADLEDQLTRGQVEQEVLQAEILAAEEQLSGAGAGVVVSESAILRGLSEDAEVEPLAEQLAEKRRKLRQIAVRSRWGEDDPAYRRAQTELEADELALDELRTRNRAKVEEWLRAERVEERRDELRRMQADLKRSQLLNEHLRDRYARLTGREGQGEGQGDDLSALAVKRQELQQAENVLNLISQRVLYLTTEQSAPGQVSLLRSASPPTKAVKSRRAQMVAVASLFGFCCPLLLAFVTERRAMRAHGATMLAQQSHLRVVGETPRLPVECNVLRDAMPPSWNPHLPIFCESVDALRTCLMMSGSFQETRTLAVTSAVSGEGKTTIAAQLAASVAEALGEQVVVVDGDMRRPAIHNLFRVPRAPGLAEVLLGSVPVEDAIEKSWNEHLHLLPAGKLRKSPHNLVGKGQLEPVLKELVSLYGFVVIDTPPVLAASEAVVIASTADASILCAMEDESRIDRIIRAHERLFSAGANCQGIVLNAVSPKQYGHRYGRYSYDYR